MATKTLLWEENYGVSKAMARHKPAVKKPKQRVQINGVLAKRAEEFALTIRGQQLHEFVQSLLERELLLSGVDPFATGKSASESREEKR
jgi:hypothetical protein